MFPLFLKRTADVMALCLSVVCRQLVRQGSFLVCWRQANVTPIPKGPPSSSVANYRPISKTSVFPKVFERLVSVHLGWFIECSGVLPTTQFAYWKGLGTCDALLYVSHTLQSALEGGQEARMVQIGFSAASDKVNHLGSFSINSALWVLEVLSCLYWQFLSNRSQHIMVDGCWSKLVNVASEVPQGSVSGMLLFLLYT